MEACCKVFLNYITEINTSFSTLCFSMPVEGDTCCLPFCPGESVCPGGIVSRAALLVQPGSQRNADGGSAHEDPDLLLLHNAETDGVVQHSPRGHDSSTLQRPHVPRGEPQLRGLLHQNRQNPDRRPEHI